MKQITVNDDFYKLDFKRGDGDWKLKTDSSLDVPKPMFEVYNNNELLGFYVGFKEYVVFGGALSLLSESELKDLCFRVS